jgi:serine/threonine-protein kinase HipA
MNGELVGNWSTHPGRPDVFAYDPHWLKSDGARPVSLSMPLLPTPFTGAIVSAYFDNLLPDARAIRQRIQHRFEVASTKAFDLLAQIGRDCVGAIQLLPPGEHHHVRSIEATPVKRDKVEGILLDMLQSGPTQATEEFRISLAGAQEKTALLYQDGRWFLPKGTTPTTHILKLPIGTGGGGIDLTTSVENEWLCSRILRAYDVPVANCWMDEFGKQRVLVVERFDRRLSNDKTWMIRLPQEDLCQSFGKPSDQKYESDGGPGIVKIMEMLLGSSNAESDRYDFLKTQMIFWMLCAIDGHAKNFSVFLEAGGDYRLTPRYDVLSAYPVLGTSHGKLPPKKVKMAMAVESTHRHYLWHKILPRHWRETARRCGMRSRYETLRSEIIDRTDEVLNAVKAQLPDQFPQVVSAPIFAGLKKTSLLLRSDSGTDLSE